MRKGADSQEKNELAAKPREWQLNRLSAGNVTTRLRPLGRRKEKKATHKKKKKMRKKGGKEKREEEEKYRTMVLFCSFTFHLSGGYILGKDVMSK